MIMYMVNSIEPNQACQIEQNINMHIKKQGL